MILANLNPWLALYTLLGAFVIACLWLIVSDLLRAANTEVERHVQAALSTEADDWSEPSRERVEATWTDEALGRVLAALDETDGTRSARTMTPRSHGFGRSSKTGGMRRE